MPRKWSNSKGINVFNEKAADRSIRYIAKEVMKKEEPIKKYKSNYKKKGVK